MRIFRDRRDAGEQLAIALESYAERDGVVVVALPRGGVPVAYEIASYLEVPLDVLIVRKLGVPGHAELAMGAIASNGVQVVDRRIVDAMHVSRDAFEVVVETEREELVRRERLFRGDRPALDVRGKTVILVDDGVATGATMLASIDALRAMTPSEIVVAVPVIAPEIAVVLRARAGTVIALAMPRRLAAVGLWYEDFTQTSDAEVRDLIARAPGLLPFLTTQGGHHAEPTAQTERKR